MAPTSMRDAPSRTMRSAARSRPSPRCTPASVARMGVVTSIKIPPTARPMISEMPGKEPESGGSRGFLERPREQHPVDVLAVERLALEEGEGQQVKILEIRLEELARARRAVRHDALDLGVDEDGRLFTVVLGARHLAAQKDVLLGLAESERPHLVGHAPLADHLARHVGRLLEVIPGAGGLLLENDLLGGAASEQDGDLVDQELLGR